MPAELKSGTCSICMEKLTEDLVGVRCCKCQKRFHLSCGKIDNKNKKDGLANWGCVSCIQNQEIKNMIRLQDSKLKEIEGLTLKMNHLSSEWANLKESLPDMIAEKVDAAVADSCKQLCGEVESVKTSNQAMCSKVSSIQRNDLRRDIVISGLPSSVEQQSDLFNIIKKVSDFHNVGLSVSDIYSVFWIKRSKLLLVKFNSLIHRDQLMKTYHQKKSLALRDVIDCDIASRVYLNDNHPDDLRRMLVYARKLRKLNLVQSFSIDYKHESVKMVSADGRVSSFDDFKKMLTEFPIMNGMAFGNSSSNPT